MQEQLVTVATFDDSIRAALAKNRLDAEGIAAILYDELTVATDWGLSMAVGGIKLQVAPLDVERAEDVLSEIVAPAEEEVSVPASPEAERERAEERQAERDEQNPSNQLADRAWRANIGGFLFFPLHLYAWLLLLSLLASPDRVSADRRWKVWGAAILNLPTFAAVIFASAFAASFFPQAPTDFFAEPHWREEGFIPFGKQAWIRFPNPSASTGGDTVTADGERSVHRFYYTQVKSQHFGLLLAQYPPKFANLPVEQLYQRQIQNLLDHNASATAPARVVEEKKAILAGWTGKEVSIAGQRSVRCRMVIADNELYCLTVIGAAEEMRNDLAAEFFASFRLR
jgi:hypothetical protein